LPDALQYTSFWWAGDEDKCFGFVLSPREGERLRRLIRQRQEKAESPPRVRVHVDARLYDGALEVVSATIPGESDDGIVRDEEIVLVGHLCHPLPSCNDNASGAAAALEVARALQRLIDAGKLEPPRRTLRFLWLPEMTGTYAFLSANEALIPRMVAGLNLDMVGQDQDECGSVMLLEHPPDATPSFAPDLLARLRELLLPEVKAHTQLGGYPLFRHATIPFSGGSDHYIFSDPSVGVPMPMIIQWPDKFYHTTADTLDKVDPAMLGKVCVLSAAYVYWLAQAGAAEAEWLASEMSARFRQRVIHTTQDARTDADGNKDALRHKLDYWLEQHQGALESLSRLAPVAVGQWQAEATACVEAEFERVACALPQESDDAEADESDDAAARLIPRRLFRGPLAGAGHVSRLDEATRDEWWELNKQINQKMSWTASALAQYWADGQRSVAEIARRIGLEADLDAAPLLPLLVDYFRFLERLGVLELTE
jgi:hypothetical protein